MGNIELIEKINELGCRSTIEAILTELERAEKKFPFWPDDIIHAAAIVGEESGELIRAAIQYRYEGGKITDCKKEAIQTGAMAVRFLKRTLTYETP